MLQPGLYEQLIDAGLARALDSIPAERIAEEAVDPAESAYVLSEYIAEAARGALEAIGDGAPEKQLKLINRMLGALKDGDREVPEPARKLTALLAEKDPRLIGGKAADLPRPETSIAASSLFTGAAHEPAMFAELKSEIASADSVDMLVSFIRWSGLRLIIEELKAFTQRGGRLRVITTSYIGATEVKAIDELVALPNTAVRISYDTKRTRLHAKTYVFTRDTGFTTAYIGSSNLSNAAVSSGMEWNVKVTAKDQPDILRKVMTTFDSYWHSDEFEDYVPASHDRLREALDAERDHGVRRDFLFDIRPYPYQQEILDRLRAEREVRGHFRNLVVAATGTGKTVISALDYRAFRAVHAGQANRLLFIAHREEILKQSIETFRGVLKDVNFGELWVGNYRPEHADHIFISVQTLASQRLWERLPDDHFDYIVVDETHHASADSYDTALRYFRPKILLGLTATPERMDGKDILGYFDGRIAAEIRLPEAIDRKLLCPFQYFGVSDTADLKDLKWTRGGYDRKALTDLYTFSAAVSERRADHILTQLIRYSADMDRLKALGFCVSIEHAHFMARRFELAGVPSVALDSHSSDEDRRNAVKRLVSGEIKVIFTVDLYNEGVDIPQVNTVLFLRPTESLTIFLQQLGRGLRLCEGKDCLTVLDFIGAANRHYDFEKKFTALLDDERTTVEREIKRGFIAVPKGCYIRLEKKAQDIVLENIRSAYSGRRKLVSRIASLAEEIGHVPTLSEFLQDTGLDPRAVYRYSACYARLCVEAGIRNDYHEPAEEAFSGAMIRLAAIDSRRWLSFLKQLPKKETFTEEERLMLSMFHAAVWDVAVSDENGSEVSEHLRMLRQSPVLCEELDQLYDLCLERIGFIDQPSMLPYTCPLDLHCTYSLHQLLAGLGYTKFGAMRQGVLYLPEKKTDILLITLNKSDKDYSPTTMYNDYAVNSTLFHWQSQSTTSENSQTGQRYIHHAETGNRVLLFVREYKKDNWGTMNYTFLGEADYVRHEGSRPMNVLWHLKTPIPAKCVRQVQQVMG